MPLPPNLPPSYRGKAFRFGYDLCLSVNIGLPGPGKRQRTKEVVVPIRVWSHVSVSHPVRTYDVLSPIIQRQDKAKVVEHVETTAPLTQNDDVASLHSYAKHLVDASAQETNAPPRPLSPSSHAVPRSQPSNRRASTSSRRRGSFIEGDDELVVEAEGGCGQAVEILSRNSQKCGFKTCMTDNSVL
jgi:hypothetical protein